MGFADTYFRSTVVWSLGADMALDGVVSKDRVPVSSYERLEYPAFPHQDDIRETGPFTLFDQPVPRADWCERELVCSYEEELGVTAITDNWYESNGATLFSIMRRPVIYNDFTGRPDTRIGPYDSGGGKYLTYVAEEESTDINALKGKGPGKGKGKGKGKDQKGGKDKGKGKGGQAQQGKGVNAVSNRPNFTGCFIWGGPHYARGCAKKHSQPGAANLEPCPAGAVTTLCTLRVGEERPESKRPGGPSAPGLGDKGTSTHNMFESLSEWGT